LLLLLGILIHQAWCKVSILRS